MKMPSWLPAYPYPPAGDGYWSPVTSTLNWCEEVCSQLNLNVGSVSTDKNIKDYYATAYSAEIINSVTNLWFIYLAYKGVTNCLRNGHDRVFLCAFLSYLMIGIGSFIFHATLKYPMQLLDELSMIYTTCILFFATFEYGRPTRAKVLLAALVTVIAMTVTGYYHYLGDPLFHQNMFALLTAIVFLKSLVSMELILRPSRRGKDPSIDKLEQERRDGRDEQILKTMWQMVPCGLLSVGAGFLIWNLDSIYCSNLRSWRRSLGLPWGILLEGHGWWHLFTGVAEYFNIVWSIWLRYCMAGRQDEVTLVWPSLWTSTPRVERRKHKALGKEI